MALGLSLTLVEEVLRLSSYRKVLRVDTSTVIAQMSYNLPTCRHFICFTPGYQFIHPQTPFAPLQACGAVRASKFDASVRSFHALFYQFIYSVTQLYLMVPACL